MEFKLPPTEIISWILVILLGAFGGLIRVISPYVDSKEMPLFDRWFWIRLLFNCIVSAFTGYLGYLTAFAMVWSTAWPFPVIFTGVAGYLGVTTIEILFSLFRKRADI